MKRLKKFKIYENTKEEYGFILKDINLFKSRMKDSIPSQKPIKLPEMNSIKDFSTWLVKQLKTN